MLGQCRCVIKIQEETKPSRRYFVIVLRQTIKIQKKAPRAKAPAQYVRASTYLPKLQAPPLLVCLVFYFLSNTANPYCLYYNMRVRDIKVSKRTYLILFVIILVLGAGYLFFTKTNRGSSWALYAIAGRHAPLSVKMSCAKETDERVATKFSLPLKFDTKTKNELRGFWYYSYYRGCLFKNGFDFSGNPIPSSTITPQTGKTTQYANPYVGITLSVPQGTIIATDNVLDVDFDDRLHVSQLTFPNGTLVINAYKKVTDPEELLAKLKEGLVVTLPDATIVNYLGERKVLDSISSQITL